MTNTNKRITWKGDFSNLPRSGVVVSDDGYMMAIQWDDGTATTVPTAITRTARWSVAS